MGKTRPRRSGMRRSHLKRFSASVVNVGRGPRRDVIKEYNDRVASMEQDQILTFGVEIHKIFGVNIIGEKVKDKLFDYANWTYTDLTPGRSDVMRRRTQSMLRDVPLHHNVCLYKDKVRRIYMFFNDTNTMAFFAESIGTDFIRVSLTFGNRQDAKQYYLTMGRSRICWVTHTYY